MSVYIIFANRRFRDEELKIPYEFLKKNGLKPLLVSDKKTEAIGKLGMHIMPEITIKEIICHKGDVLMFTGGPGTSVFYEDKELLNIIREYNELGNLICAICISPVILAKAGVLKDKRCTVWIDGKEEIEKYGAVFIKEDVVKDGNIITANGPKAAKKYVKEIYSTIKSRNSEKKKIRF